jgi:hypothetical protein
MKKIGLFFHENAFCITQNAFYDPPTYNAAAVAFNFENKLELLLKRSSD